MSMLNPTCFNIHASKTYVSIHVYNLLMLDVFCPLSISPLIPMKGAQAFGAIGNSPFGAARCPWSQCAAEAGEQSKVQECTDFR